MNEMYVFCYPFSDDVLHDKGLGDPKLLRGVLSEIKTELGASVVA